MTIGQRIAQKRKEQGLSQETLGEALGVSRQSVYKWESDSALPEIDKLIAMSRLFGVTVGWLLGVEEPEGQAEKTEPAAGNGELTEEQLKMVEEIVGRYMAAQPRPKKRRWPWVAGIAAALVLVWTLWNLNSQLDTLDSRYSSLQNSVNSITSNVNSQIGGIADRVEEVLKSQNNLTADYGTEIVSADLAQNTVTIAAYATPKTYTEGMEALFQVDTGDGPVEYAGERGPGNAFSAQITCELTDSITVSVVFITGDKRETQVLYVYSGLYSDSMPSAYAESNLMWKELDENGDLVFKDEYVYIMNVGQATPVSNASVGCAGIHELKVGLFRNRKLVTWLEPCEWPQDRFHGSGWEDCRFFRYPDMTIIPAEGDVFGVAALVIDEYGREMLYMSEPYAVDPEEGELWFADEIAGSGFKEGWYDPDTWSY